MKLGIGTYCTMWACGVDNSAPPEPLTPLGLLDEAERLGVRVVQFGPNRPLSDAEAEPVAATARERGIELELGITGMDAAVLAAGAERCKRMGATLLRTVDLYEGAAPGVREFTEALRRAALVMESAGVRLAVENARIPARVMAEALAAVGSPWLGITLDTVNSLAIPEGTEEVVGHLAPYTLCLHVKDFRVKRIWHMMGFEVTGTPAGEGQLNVGWLLGQLREAGADPNAILELWVPQQNSIAETIAMERAWMEESIRYLRQHVTE